MTGHSEKHLGLQQHSIGEFYPWSIVVRKRPNSLIGVLRPENLITGQHGPTQLFDWGGFILAHRKAEQWIAARDYLEAMDELSILGYPQ